MSRGEETHLDVVGLVLPPANAICIFLMTNPSCNCINHVIIASTVDLLIYIYFFACLAGVVSPSSPLPPPPPRQFDATVQGHASIQSALEACRAELAGAVAKAASAALECAQWREEAAAAGERAGEAEAGRERAQQEVEELRAAAAAKEDRIQEMRCAVHAAWACVAHLYVHHLGSTYGFFPCPEEAAFASLVPCLMR